MPSPEAPTPDSDLCRLQERLGRPSMPVDVHAVPTHGFAVAFRVPLEAGARLLPAGGSMREVGSTGRGIVCLCGGEFRGARVGKLSIPAPSHQDYHCRVVVDHTLEDVVVPAGYTLHYEASSRLVELYSGHLPPLRRPPSKFESEEDESRWSARCTSKEPLACMAFETHSQTTSWMAPDSTSFDSLRAASEFLLDLGGHLVHDHVRDKTLFQPRGHCAHDVSFCRDFAYEFPLLDHLNETFDLHAEFDCALFVRALRPARELTESQQRAVLDGETTHLPAGC